MTTNSIKDSNSLVRPRSFIRSFFLLVELVQACSRLSNEREPKQGRPSQEERAGARGVLPPPQTFLWESAVRKRELVASMEQERAELVRSAAIDGIPLLPIIHRGPAFRFIFRAGDWGRGRRGLRVPSQTTLIFSRSPDARRTAPPTEGLDRLY